MVKWSSSFSTGPQSLANKMIVKTATSLLGNLETLKNVPSGTSTLGNPIAFER